MLMIWLPSSVLNFSFKVDISGKSNKNFKGNIIYFSSHFNFYFETLMFWLPTGLLSINSNWTF